LGYLAEGQPFFVFPCHGCLFLLGRASKDSIRIPKKCSFSKVFDDLKLPAAGEAAGSNNGYRGKRVNEGNALAYPALVYPVFVYPA